MRELCDRQNVMVRSWTIIRNALLLVWYLAVSLMTTELLAQEPDYFPLQVGDFWRYEDWCVYTYEWTLEITRTDTIRGKEYHVVEQEIPISQQLFVHFLRKDEQNQVWEFFPRDSAEYQVYKLNADVGESWQYSDIARVSLLRRDVGGSACATDFHQFAGCLEFRFDYGEFDGRNILADGAGPIWISGEGCQTNLVGARIAGQVYGSLTSAAQGAVNGDAPRESRVRCLPNPFNSATTIRYALPDAAEVRLEIYNLLGQRIHTLVVQWQPAGYHLAIWDGRDADGEQMGSGIYVVRFQAGGHGETGRVALLR